MEQVAQEADQLLGGSEHSCLLIDESSFVKKGKHSVGVAHQWCGRQGKVDNCQVGVFAAMGRGHRATLVDFRLYLPKGWPSDDRRCKKAGIPAASQVFKTKPELLATGPNQLWSWDITKLKGPEKWNYFHLYVILDVYSRCVVGWMVADRELATLAKTLIQEACDRQQISPDQLTLHADRGSSMKSKLVAQLLADLGVTKTHSRPHVSNDNPFSEAHFKTMKYRPSFPERFGCIEDARAFCQDFFHWYNTVHRHSGIAFMTPESVHRGKTAAVIEARTNTLRAAFADHPGRFKSKCPKPQTPPEAAWINPPSTMDDRGQDESATQA